MNIIPALFAALAAMPLFAQQVQDCAAANAPTYPQLASAIAEPWEANTRRFADGQVRLAVMDSHQAGLAAYWLLVLFSPSEEEADQLSCALISNDEFGFSGITLEGVEVQESPLGPVISVPTRFLNPTDSAIPLESDYKWGRLEVLVDRVNMKVTATRM